MSKCATRYDELHMENNQHNRIQSLILFTSAGSLGYHLFRLRSCKGPMELSATNKSREETLANALLAYNPSWEETEEGMVLVVVDGWEMFLKEKGSKGQRLLNEVDPEKVALAYNYVPKGESNASSAADQRMVEFVNAELPGAPEDIQAHEITEFEVDAETAPLLMSLTGKPSRACAVLLLQ